MPITNKQFEQGLDKTRNKVIDFLEANPGKAFLYTEIADGVGISAMILKRVYYEMLFESMVLEGIIEKKIINLHSYFRAPIERDQSGIQRACDSSES